MSEKNKKQKTLLITSGASGGHVFPAVAVAEELRQKGYRCLFAGNGKHFEKLASEAGFETTILPASPFNVKNPLVKLKALFNLFLSFWKAFKVIHEHKVSAVFGTGGYATVATMLAARVSGVPTIIQEQNVLPGRANRMLAKWVDAVCLSFDDSRHYFPHRENVFVTTGNPVRKEVLAASETKRAEKGEVFRILILGGSHGARILSDVVPPALSSLPERLKARVEVIQQARKEDVGRVINHYKNSGIKAQVQEFFEDLPEKMVSAHLVIGRSGASTVMECALLGRAAVLVPLKLADGHQLLNAKVMEKKGAALILEQQHFTPARLCDEVAELMKDKKRLHAMEEASKALAQPQAALKVADEVVKQADHDVMHLIEELSETPSSEKEKEKIS